MNLRPLEFTASGMFELLGTLNIGDFFRFKNKKLVYRLDKVDQETVFYSTYSRKYTKDFRKIIASTVEIMSPLKPKVLASFSAGETSAYMVYLLQKLKSDEWDLLYVIANTGQEDEASLVFAKAVQEWAGIPLHWVEAVIDPIKGNGIRHKEINFKSAHRGIDIFEQTVKKHGLFNRSNPTCSERLKANPIQSFAKSKGWKQYYTAIGIRADEIDRMSMHRKTNKIIYPLISLKEMTKIKINGFWAAQDFRLNLKGYQGNCSACWKKSDKKLRVIARENPAAFDGFKYLEDKYANFVPEGRDASGWTFPVTMFRSHRTAKDIFKEAAENPDLYVDDDHQIYPDEEDESCEIWSQCGKDN